MGERPQAVRSTSFRLPVDVVEEALALAHSEGCSLTAVVTEALRVYIDAPVTSRSRFRLTY